MRTTVLMEEGRVSTPDILFAFTDSTMVPKRRKLNNDEEEHSCIARQRRSIDILLCEKIGLLKNPDKSLRLQALAFASAHLKYASPHNLKHHIKDVLQQQLWDEEDPLLTQHIIKLLGDVANSLPEDTALCIVDTLHKYLESHQSYGGHLITQIVASLICIAQHSGSFRELDGPVVLSLLSTAKTGLRTRLLNLLAVTTKSRDMLSTTKNPKGIKDDEGGCLVFQIFEAFTMDPYPSVRKAALEGLISLHRKGYHLTKDCYKRAVTLLQDKDEFVRLLAIQVISGWVEMLHQREETYAVSLIDEAFLQVCTMSRDMNMKVRREALYALGRMGPISESMLHQALSKRLLRLDALKQLSNAFATEIPEDEIDLVNWDEGSQLLTLSAAGAFVHGVEDEFLEVRIAAIDSLARLSAFSKEFADDALDLLMDMLNDDSVKVRMQTLCSLFHMADIDRLTVQEKHMHMFLGMLEDINASVREAARRLLGRMELPTISVFKMSIEAMMNNLEKHPQDEQDIIYVMYCIGKNHGTFVVCSATEFVQQIMTYTNKDSGLDQPQLPALLILLLAAQMSNVGILFHIPQKVLLYAKYFCGKFSAAVIGSTANAEIQNFLLEDLQKHSKNGNLEGLLASKSDGTKLSVHGVIDVMYHRAQQSFDCDSIKSRTKLMALDSDDIFSKTLLKHCETSAHGTDLSERRQFVKGCPHENEIMHSATNIVKTVAGIWPLIKTKALSEVFITLSGCRADMEKIKKSCQALSSVTAFASLYIHCVHLLAKLWARLTPGNCQHIYQSGIDSSQNTLEQLDEILRRMMYCFLGLCEEQQLCVLELNALSYILRLSLLGTYGSCLTQNRLSSIVSLADLFDRGDGVKQSAFLGRIKQLFDKDSNLACYSKLIRELPEVFSLAPIPLGSKLKEIRAALFIPNNNSEQPLQFKRGIPLGITMHITLHNISSACRIWLLMVLGDEVQHNLLDVNEFEGLGGLKRGTITIPFYATLKAAICSLEISVHMECPSDHDKVLGMRFQAGPKWDLISLSNVEKIYLAVSCENR